jgi:hypothetical protein
MVDAAGAECLDLEEAGDGGERAGIEATIPPSTINSIIGHIRLSDRVIKHEAELDGMKSQLDELRQRWDTVFISNVKAPTCFYVASNSCWLAEVAVCSLAIGHVGVFVDVS